MSDANPAGATPVVRLTEADVALLTRRFTEHGNSFRAMLAALGRDDASADADRLRLLRRLERRVGLDLAELCGRLHAAPDAHPLEQRVLHYLTEWTDGPDARELLVFPERVREVRALMDEGRLVGDPDS